MDAYVPPLWSTAVVFALLISIGGLAWLARDRTAWRRRLEDRFLLGIPWGSIIALSLVLAVYMFVQDGIGQFGRPVFLPFVNWSYLYPTGVIFAAFSHAGAGHLIGNLAAAAVLAPLAEYVWGHYPKNPSGRSYDHPAIRAVVLFPGAILAFGLFNSLFTWGPVIGFSGVVFGLAGFAVVRYPIITIVALLGRSAIQEIGRALLDPIEVAEVGTSLITPSWAGVSFQGHALGFLAGAFLGILLLHRRDRAVDPVRVWLGTVLVMIGMGVWSIWSTAGEDTYILYRGLGFALLFLVGLLITVAAVASDRPIRGWLTRRRAAVLGLAIPIIVLAGIAIPLNLVTVVDYETPDRSISVEGYDVYYDTDAESRLQPVIAPSSGGGSASGVILVDDDRHMWTEAVSTADLSRTGDERIAIGGILTRADVTAQRTGWNPVRNETVYRVVLEHDGMDVPAYASESRDVDLRVAGHNIAIDADIDEGFVVVVTGPDGETARASIPERNESTEVAGLTIERQNALLVASSEDTRVSIARHESGG